MHALRVQIFPEKFVWSLSPFVTGRKKIGGFQRLTSVLEWWLTAMGTRRKGGPNEERDWRRLLFEGREADPAESTGVWLCYSHCFLVWFESLFACTKLPWLLLSEPAGESDADKCCQLQEHQWLWWWREEMKCQCIDIKVLWKRGKTYLMEFSHLYSVFCHRAALCLKVSFRSL